jgi:hypothetical protein
MQQKLNRNAPALLLAAAALVAAVLTVVLTWKMSFYADTWELLMNRRDPTVDSLLQPHNEHWVLFPTLFEQIFLRLFGMTSALPEYLLLTAFLVATALLVYVYVKRRVGPWLALFAAVLVLFLGPAWEVLLWPFEISFCGPVLLGLAALLLLEREDRRGDLLACLFLTLALGFSSLGVPFIVGAFVAVAQRPRRAWRSGAFVFAIPLAVFLVWYLGWGHDAESHLSLNNVLASPRFVAESLAYSVGGLVGLGTSPETGVDSGWGRAVLVAVVIGVGVWLYRRRRIYAGLWPIAAVAVTNWLLTAFNAFPGRDPSASRYQYTGAIFILLILANLFQGVRLGRNALIGIAALTLLAVGPNLVVLKNGADFFKDQAVLTRADTAALEIARGKVDPAFQLTPEVAGTPVLIDISAERYFRAVDEYGSPAYSLAELEDAPQPGRRQADVVLANALGISTVTQLDEYAAAPAAGCVEVAGGGAGPIEVPVAEGSRVELAPGPSGSFSMRRFSVGEFPVSLQPAEGDSTTTLTIPADGVALPWLLHVEATQAARVCPA